MGLLNHTLCAHHVQNEDRFPEQLPRLAAPTSNLQTTQSHEGFRPMKHPKGTPCSQHSDTTNGCFNLCCMSGPQPSDWAPLHAKPSGRITQCRLQPTCRPHSTRQHTMPQKTPTCSQCRSDHPPTRNPPGHKCVCMQVHPISQTLNKHPGKPLTNHGCHHAVHNAHGLICSLHQPSNVTWKSNCNSNSKPGTCSTQCLQTWRLEVTITTHQVSNKTTCMERQLSSTTTCTVYTSSGTPVEATGHSIFPNRTHYQPD